MLIGPSVQLFKKWPWKSKFKVMGEVKVKGHNVSPTSLWFHVNWPSHSWDTAFSKFDLEEGIPLYRFISFSFHVDRPSHSWDTAILKFDIENSRSRSWVRSKMKVTTWIQHSVDSHAFRSMSIGHPIPGLPLFSTQLNSTQKCLFVICKNIIQSHWESETHVGFIWLHL